MLFKKNAPTVNEKFQKEEEFQSFQVFPTDLLKEVAKLLNNLDLQRFSKVNKVFAKVGRDEMEKRSKITITGMVEPINASLYELENFLNSLRKLVADIDKTVAEKEQLQLNDFKNRAIEICQESSSFLKKQNKKPDKHDRRQKKIENSQDVQAIVKILLNLRELFEMRVNELSIRRLFYQTEIENIKKLKSIEKFTFLNPLNTIYRIWRGLPLEEKRNFIDSAQQLSIFDRVRDLDLLKFFNIYFLPMTSKGNKDILAMQHLDKILENIHPKRRELVFSLLKDLPFMQENPGFQKLLEEEAGKVVEKDEQKITYKK